MKDLKSAKLDDVNNFSAIVDSLYSYIKKNWKGTIKPKGYKKFLENYEDYDGMEELDGKALENEFKGFKDSSACSFSFPLKVSLPHVAYDDTNQGRKPLNTLISAILGHGLMVGERRGHLKSLKALEMLETSIKYEIAIAKATGKPISEEGVAECFKFFKDFSHV